MSISYITLPNRGAVKVSGPDRFSFLQNLVTNDVKLLEAQPLVYACLLTPQGKFLHDFFMRSEGESIILDCEGGARAGDLAERLSRYKLRADITIDCEKDVNVYADAGENGEAYPDPRHPEIGFRTYQKPLGDESPFEVWDTKRIELCLPDGSRDLIPEKSTLAEGGLETLNAISFDKGCYVGQELTARMHHRGLAKRKLQTVKLDALPDGAELRSSCGDVGLALVKI